MGRSAVAGKKSYNLGHDAGGVALARLGDGKILIRGGIHSSDTSNELDYLVLRIHPNGDIDTSFGNNGLFIKDSPASVQGQSTMDGIDEIRILPDGKILATGTSTRYIQSQLGVSHARTLKLNHNGTLDTAFAVEGASTTEIGFGDYLAAGLQDSTSSIDPQNRQVVGAIPYSEPTNYSSYGCKILRYLPNGSLDTSFAQKGVKILTPGQISSCADFAFLPDGKVLVLYGWAVTRLNEDGSTDTSFANGGILNLGPLARFGDLLATADGKFYVKPELKMST